MISAQVGAREPVADQRHLVGLDIDGTLLVTGHHPTPAVLDSIRAARAVGHELVLATGRSLSGALHAAKLLGIMDGWLVASNGSVVIHMTSGAYEIVSIHTVHAQSVVELVSYVRPELLIAAELVGVGYFVSKPFPENELGGEQFPVTEIEDLYAQATPRLAIYGENAQYLVPSIRATGMTAIRTRPDWIDVTPGGVDKSTALETIRRKLGIPKDRTVAIGDGENDREMLAWANRGVAMGHAPAMVRFAAKYATKSIEDDGAALILNSLVPQEENFAGETRTEVSGASR